jgi:hypothetical protein
MGSEPEPVIQILEFALTYSPLFAATAAVGAWACSMRNSYRIQDIHVSINSRMDELLKQTGLASKAEGKVEGIAQQKAEK